MGGFRFNGCGASDHFKKLKCVGTFQCPRCGKVAEFFITEANFKIDIFFIPTVTLKTRYAVICGKCKEGEFCSEQWAVKLLNSEVPVPVLFESEAQAEDTAVAEAPSAPTLPPPQTELAPPPMPSAREGGYPTFCKCLHCGVTQLREGAFCAYCGKPLLEEKQDAPTTVAREEQAVCPSCGSAQEPGMAFCASCGQMMAAEKPSAPGTCPVCGAKAEESATFCMECGTKL